VGRGVAVAGGSLELLLDHKPEGVMVVPDLGYPVTKIRELDQDKTPDEYSDQGT
jgi:hypothetical protein